MGILTPITDAYRREVVPRFIDKACGSAAMKQGRDAAAAGLTGVVVEIGFGSGHNVPFYPSTVTAVAAIEPADVGWQLASKRLASATVPVERTGLDGQSLPLDDDSCDTALSTWTLCTIPDVAVALGEVRRAVRWTSNLAHGKRDVRQTLTKAEFVEGGTIGPVPKVG